MKKTRFTNGTPLCDVTFVAAVLAALGTGAADVLFVPEQYPTIQAAVDAANDFDQIFVGPGTYKESIAISDKHLFITSTMGAEQTRIEPLPDKWAVVWSKTAGGATLSGFTIDGNGVPGSRGISLSSMTGSMVIESCIFRDLGGRAIEMSAASPVLLANVLVHNNATEPSVRVQNSSAAHVLNSTFAHNAGGAISVQGFEKGVMGPSLLTMRNSIVWGNAGGVTVGESAVADIAWSNVQGGASGSGNIQTDPMFVDSAAGNFRLAPGSPCIDTASAYAIVFGNSHLALDLDRETRVVDDPDSPNIGPSLWGLAVDMGAYEFQPQKIATCPEDLSGDGVVGVADLLLLLSKWGRCP